MSRKKADANLLDMPGVPAAPKSPFSADAVAALKPAAQPAAAAVQPKLPIPAKPVTQTRQVPYGAGPLPTRQPPQDTRFSLRPPIPLPTNRQDVPGRSAGFNAAAAATAATAPGFRPEVPLSDKPPVRVEDWPNNSPPGDPVEMRQQQQRYNRLLERQQQRARDAAPETPYLPGLNEFLGFERTDPRTGKRVHTTPPELGQDQAGANGAVSAGVSGIPAMAVSLLPLLAGNADPFWTSARDVVSPLNHYFGTDIGHNWKPDAAVSSAYEPENPALRESFTRAKSSPTTPGFFSSPYDPLTETYKPSVADGAAAMSRHFADDQTNGANKLQRILAGTHSAVASNAGKAIAALTPARAMKYVAGAPALLSNPFATGAVVQGGAALTDPSITGNATQRGLHAAVKGLEGAYSPLAANPLLVAPQETANQFGAQDAANAAGQWIRNTPWGTAQTKTPTPQREGVMFVRDLYGGMGGVPGDSAATQRALAHGAAGVVESLPTTLPALFTGGPKSLLGDPKAIQKGMYNARNYIANSATTGGIQGATNTAPPVSDKPVLSQADDAVTANLWDMHAKEQRANPAIGDNTGAMAELLRRQQVQNPATEAAAAISQAPAQAAPAQPAPQQPDFDYQHVLPNYGKAQQFAETNPKMTAQITAEAAKSIQTAATSPEGKQEVLQLQQTGDLSPKANETVKYNLINDGFDADKIGEWYGNLGGAEKFALWGGVSMTVLGLMHAMNGGGVGGMLAALLGLGTAGLTIGQSGLVGDAAQEQAQKVTQPITAGIHSVIGKALENPTIMKTVAPYFDHLSDDTLLSMQDGMRKSTNPETQKSVQGLDMVRTATGLPAWAGGGMIGDVAKSTAVNKLVEKGFSQQTAKRWVDLWLQSK